MLWSNRSVPFSLQDFGTNKQYKSLIYDCTVKNELSRSIRITVQRSCVILFHLVSLILQIADHAHDKRTAGLSHSSIEQYVWLETPPHTISAEKPSDDPRNQVHLTSHTCTYILYVDPAESRGDVAIQTHAFPNTSGTKAGHTGVGLLVEITMWTGDNRHLAVKLL